MNPMKLITALLTICVCSLMAGPLLGAAAGMSALEGTLAFGTGITLLGLTGLGALPGVMTVTYDASALRTAFGSYYIQGSQSEKDLYTRLFWGSEIDVLFQKRESVDTRLRSSLANLTGGPQPFQVDFTEKGTLSFTPQEILMYYIKDDRSFIPHEAAADWIGFLGPQNGETEMTCPFPKYVTEHLVLPVFEEGMEILEAYAGVYAAPTPGTAGPDGTSMNGIKKVINLGIAATTITPIASGAWAADDEDFVDQMEVEFVREIDAKDRRKSKMVIATSIANHEKYRRGKRKKYNSSWNQTSSLDTIEDSPNIEVRGFAALGTSEKVFCSPLANSRVGVKRGDHQSRYQFEQQDRKIKMWLDFWKGYGWLDHGRVYTNDLETS